MSARARGRSCSQCLDPASPVSIWTPLRCTSVVKHYWWGRVALTALEAEPKMDEQVLLRSLLRRLESDERPSAFHL